MTDVFNVDFKRRATVSPGRAVFFIFFNDKEFER